MNSVLIPMALLIFCGAAWRIIKPGGMTADQTRQTLTAVVFYLFLPALVLSVLWHAELGLESVKISAFGMLNILFGAALIWPLSLFRKIPPARLGAAMLATAFANVTFLGLPVLEQTFGHWARSIAIQIDLFAHTPLLFTFGIVVAHHYGRSDSQNGTLVRSLLLNPPLWAAMTAMVLNLTEIPQPTWLDHILNMLSAAVVPLMLIALGLGLRWGTCGRSHIPMVLFVVAIKLLAVPWFGTWLGITMELEGETLSAVVLEAAMPSMMMGIVLCDRYQLDTSFYATLVTVSTICAMLTLPFWHHHLSFLAATP